MTQPTADPGPASAGDALRFAFSTLTVLPVPVRRWDRAAARAGMVCAPVAGAVTGLCAAAAGTILLLLGAGPLTAAVATVAVPAVLTRALHLDGLADTADGLGSGKPAGDALRIMKRSDIGPFGTVTLVLVLLAQTAALAELYGEGPAHGAAAAVVAAVAGRAALVPAVRAGVPAARPEGLGAVVAGTLSTRAVVLTLLAATAACAAAGAPLGAGAAAHAAVAAVAGPAAAALLLRRCLRRFGGVTGDVLGALVETAATVCLVVLALG
ncbi:adenosylcobinamide-GDP ribazoletransferase [Streptomyces zingiberis]|uniref:Adenosylcobinamide-GDP ribazoletransferase n=1 Tax=Streptomyces zingiberis TaxID=2053010 RepID=A0ABX1BT64_9ACTN|nr:adenosylcobinamide-GDP ribazoletransferase [Streptomyces zingiberis]NJP99749.1 adenosylcobinamide-GDP ribazoletransferase [Streptomyces zingiberis]